MPAITYATITGRITIPGTEVGIRAQVTATPLTTDNVLVHDDRTDWGSVVAETDNDGNLPATFKLPTNGYPAEALWKFVVTPLEKKSTLRTWTLGVFDVTASTTIQALLIAGGIDVTAVDVTFREDITDIAGSAQAAATTAAASATSAAASAAAAQAIVLADAEGAVDALLADPASDPSVRLASSFAAVRDALRPTMQIRTTPAPMASHACAAGHSWVTGTGSLGTIDPAATDQIRLGSQSVKMVTNGAGNALRLDSPVVVDMTGKMPVLWLRFDDIARAGTCELFLGTSSTLAHNYKFPIVASGSTGRFPRSGAWVKMTIPWGQAVVTGTPTRAGITYARLAFTDKGGAAPVTVHFAGLATQDEPAAYPNGVAVFTFDDGRATSMVGKRVLDKYGFAATNYPIVERINEGTAGAPGWLTIDDLYAQRESGWEIAHHAFSKAAHDATGGFTALTGAQLEAEYVGMRKWSAEHGFDGADHLAFPQGFHNDTVLDVTRRYFASARTVLGQQRESVPPADRYRLRSPDLTSTTTLAAMKANVDQIKAGKGLLIITAHEIRSVVDSFSWSEADFDALATYIAASGVAVRTLGQALRGI